MKNSLFIEAKLSQLELSNLRKKEIAEKLQLPANSQKDLLFMSAILVSTGTNKNGATFFGSELIKAKDSINQKPLDTEHREDEIIGHIVSSLYMDYEGEVIDVEGLYSEYKEAQESGKLVEISKVVSKLDGLDIDIGVICIVYKDRFPKLAQEIEQGEWKVSMECYYEDYDIKVGNILIPRVKQESFSFLDKAVDREVNLVVAGRSMGNQKVSRVLRGIKFCGVGIVKNPAEVRSVILEAAAEREKEQSSKDIPTLDLADLDGLSIIKGGETVAASIEGVVMQESDVVSWAQDYKYLLLEEEANGAIKWLTDSDTYSEASAIKEAIQRSKLNPFKRYHIACRCRAFTSTVIANPFNGLSSADVFTCYKTNDLGEVREAYFVGRTDLPEDNGGIYAEVSEIKVGPADSDAGTCISFERRIREYPDNLTSGKVVKEHWCKLFNKPCPVIGAYAKDPACLRNKASKVEQEDYNKPVNLPVVNPEIKLPKSFTVDRDVLAMEEVAKKISSSKQKICNKADLDDNFVKVALTERKHMVGSDFGLPKLRKFPINTASRLRSVMKSFSRIKARLTARQQIELYSNLVLKGLDLGVDTSEFEGATSCFSFKAGEHYDLEYAIPKLQLLPLGNRQQVISAMSRYPFLKVEISDAEKQRVVINILKAAKKFNINTEDFRKKYSVY